MNVNIPKVLYLRKYLAMKYKIGHVHLSYLISPESKWSGHYTNELALIFTILYLAMCYS